jgi:hypothetical protein
VNKLIQTRLHNSEKSNERGNCFPTVIACLMGYESPEDVIQIQEYYKGVEEEEDHNWIDVLMQWLNERNYDWYGLEGHQFDDSFYLVTGRTERGTVHVCIYKNGKLYHDPHPSGKGLTEILNYEIIERIKNPTD